MKQQQIKEKQNQARDKTVDDNWQQRWQQRCYGLELQAWNFSDKK